MPGFSFQPSMTTILTLLILLTTSYQSPTEQFESKDIVSPNFFSLENNASSPNSTLQKLNLRGRSLDLKSDGSETASSSSQDHSPSKLPHYLMEISKVNTEAVSAIMTTLAVLTNVLQPGNPAPLLLMVLSKMPKYVSETNLKSMIFDTELKSENWNLMPISMSFGPKISETYKKSFPHYPLPEAFSGQDFHSSYLVNNWKNLSTFAIIIIMMGINISLEYICRKLDLKYQKIFQYLKHVFKWNLFFTIFLSTLDDLTLFSYFEFTTFQPGNTFSILSMISCIATIGIAFTIIWAYIKITSGIKVPKRPQSSKKVVPGSLQDLLTRREAYLIFTEGFKTDTLLNKKFLLAVLSRVIIANILIGWLSQDLTIQATILTFLSCVMIACLALHGPFKQKSLQLQIVTIELLMLLVNFALIILSLYEDKILHGSQPFRKDMEYMILICLALFSILFKLFMVMVFGQAVIATYRAYKAKNSPKEVVEEEELSPSHLHERNAKFKNLTVYSPGRSFLHHKDDQNKDERDQQGQDEGERTWKKLRLTGIEISLGDSPLKPPENKPKEEKSRFQRQSGDRSADASHVRLKKDPEQDKSDIGHSIEMPNTYEKTEKVPDTNSHLNSRFSIPAIRNGRGQNGYHKFTQEHERTDELNGDNLTFQNMPE